MGVNLDGSVTATPVSGTDALGLPSLNAGTSLIPSLPPNATPAQKEAAAMAQYNASPALQQYIQQTYGYIGSYLLNVPELLPILVAAGLEGWDSGQFDAAVTQTNWWKSTSQAQRNYQELQSSNPGEAASQVSLMQSTILTEAQNLGITIPASDLKQTATFATEFGWSSDVIQQVLRTYASTNGAQNQGGANPQFGATASFAQDAKTLAGEYGISMSDSQLAGYVQQNIAGKLDAKGLQGTFEQMAAQQHPWMAASLQQGVTVSQYLSGYASAAASTLGIDPSDVNWSDPKWNSALLTTKPDGTQNPVSIGQFQQSLMKDPSYGYQNTAGARDKAYAMAGQIAQTFGHVAGVPA